MKPCPKCSHINPIDSNFCEACAAPLAEATSDTNPTKVYTIGRLEDCDLTIDRPMISGKHLQLLFQNGRIFARDMKATNGTFLGAERKRLVGEVEVTRDDVLFLGSYRITVKRLAFILQGPHPDDNLIPFKRGVMTIGRDPHSDIFLDHPLISWSHARLEPYAKGVLLVDLQATNGTYLDGQRIHKHPIQPGQTILIGPFQLTVTPKGLKQNSANHEVTLTLNELTVTAKNKSGTHVLLDHISLSIYPGELCGLMGLAGAGKTTLLKAAIGYLKPAEGRVQVNGIELHQHYDAFRTSIGYVPQEDIFHKDLTVGEAMTYAAMLRLEDSLDEEERQTLIHKVLDQLAMYETNPQIEETRIATISGGQKRRLNIAMELLSDPALFFLDEPLSGLSSEDALLVMKVLANMASDGKTILFSLHQPSREIYELLDNVIFLHRGGRLAYYGPAAPDSILFTNTELNPDEATNPDLTLRALETKEPAHWQKSYKHSSYHEEFVTQRQQATPIKKSTAKELISAPTPNLLHQFKVLFKRAVNVKLNDRLNSLTLLMQSPIIAVLIALVFGDAGDDAYQNAPTAHYLMVIACIWFGCSNAARDICGEWPIYIRERMFNLRIRPYLSARFTVGSAVCLVQCTILSTVVHVACDLQAPWLALTFGLWLTATVGVALGLLVSAFASPFKKSNEIAVGLIPIVLLPMVIMGGIIKPFKDMNDLTKGLAALTVTRWSFESSLALEAENQTEELEVPTEEGALENKPKGDIILELFFEEKHEADVLTPFMAQLSMIIIYLLATGAYLKSRDLV